MKLLSDNTHMLAVKAGEIQQLSILYDRYSKPLYGFFFRMTSGKKMESEDLVQNVFYRVLKYRHTFDGSGQFRHWVFHMARNVYADQFKKKNPLAFASNWQDVSQHPESDDQPEAELSQRQDIELLYKAMDMLGKEKRELLVLSRLQRMKYKEIAQLIGSTEGAVKVRVHRAMQELTKVYEKLESVSS